MNRWRIIVLSLMIALCSSAVTSAAPKISLIVNGKTSTAAVQVISSTTYVPLRAAAEMLGASVNYAASTKTVYITDKSSQAATPTIAKSSKMTLVVNGTISKINPLILNNTTYVPVRAASELLGAIVNYDSKKYTVTITKAAASNDITLTFPSDRYPQTAAHIASAIAKGESAICTIDRSGADENREQSLAGIPTKEGYDRDEWPMAMCAEGGAGADVAYVEPSDNRGAGAWISNQLEDYKDGTKVRFIVTSTSSAGNLPATGTESETIVYKNCTEARAAGVTPLYKGDPGYSSSLDRDSDGVACEA